MSLARAKPRTGTAYFVADSEGGSGPKGIQIALASAGVRVDDGQFIPALHSFSIISSPIDTHDGDAEMFEHTTKRIQNEWRGVFGAIKVITGVRITGAVIGYWASGTHDVRVLTKSAQFGRHIPSMLERGARIKVRWVNMLPMFKRFTADFAWTGRRPAKFNLGDLCRRMRSAPVAARTRAADEEFHTATFDAHMTLMLMLAVASADSEENASTLMQLPLTELQSYTSEVLVREMERAAVDGPAKPAPRVKTLPPGEAKEAVHDDIKLFRTPKGTRMHRSGCTFIENSTPTPVTTDDFKLLKYCSRCLGHLLSAKKKKKTKGC